MFKAITVYQKHNCGKWKLLSFVIPEEDVLDFRYEKKSFITEDSENIFESDINNYLDILNSVQLGEYTSEILDYIAGIYCKKYMQKKLCILSV